MNTTHSKAPQKTHDGTGHFLRQRLTALANIPLGLFFLFVVVAYAGADYETARAFLSRPWVSAAMLAFLGSALWHMYLGMQTIIEDYVHHDACKLLAVAANLLFCVGVGLVCLLSALRIFLVQP